MASFGRITERQVSGMRARLAAIRAKPTRCRWAHMIDLFELNTRPTERNAHHLANDIHLEKASLWRLAERRFIGRGQSEALRGCLETVANRIRC